MDRRSGKDRRANKCVLQLTKNHDHVIFAVIIVAIFVLMDLWLKYTWAGKGLEMVVGAAVHRALFGGGS